MDTGDSSKKKPEKNGKKREEKKEKKPGRLRWPIQVFCISVVLSAVLSFASEEALDGADLAMAFVVLVCFILMGIIFDIIGVAVTAADERPFHSMAARKTPGARQALHLIRRANQVSSFCNDVVGDICGIVSGATGAVIVTQLQQALNLRTVLISVGVTALVSGLTIGGKALGKTFAIQKSTKVVYWAGRVLHIFHR